MLTFSRRWPYIQRCGLDLQQPILGCGNAAEIFPDMLFSQIADGNLFSVAVHDGNAKQFLRQENALGMMPQGSVTEVRKECFRLIKPVVNRKIVFRPFRRTFLRCSPRA